MAAQSTRPPLGRNGGERQSVPFAHWPWLEGAAPPDHEVFGFDRYSALAGIGHLHVARGERTQAAALLEEMRREVERPAPLRGSAGPGAGFSSATSGAREPSADNPWSQLNMIAAQDMFNLSEDWAAYVRGHFFRRPADVVRAVELGAYGTTARLVRRFGNTWRTGT
ncbi:hypothetical protein ACFCZ1_05520 [Streptomyces sp. NPDC056224]|uniref:hypothetical protein n=1 Tax=Streptomyces sp. NPDC056224 TaxID=3345750 RepID=UPI0035D73A2E